MLSENLAEVTFDFLFLTYLTSIHYNTCAISVLSQWKLWILVWSVMQKHYVFMLHCNPQLLYKISMCHISCCSFDCFLLFLTVRKFLPSGILQEKSALREINEFWGLRVLFCFVFSNLLVVSCYFLLDPNLSRLNQYT